MTQLQQQQFDSKKKKKKKVKHVQTVNSEHNSWRPRAATRLQDHVVLLTSQRDGTYTASALRKQLRIASSLNVSDRTICNGLHEANISCRRPSVRPFVTQANRPACLAWVLLLSIPFLYFFKNLVLINRRNGPRYQRVLALCALFNRGDTEGTNSSKILCQMFVYVLFYVNLCHDWFYGLWIICGLITCVQSK